MPFDYKAERLIAHNRHLAPMKSRATAYIVHYRSQRISGANACEPITLALTPVGGHHVSNHTYINALLSGLSAAELEHLQLEPAELPHGRSLERYERASKHAYFPSRGVISVLATAGGRSSVEIGMVGREGVTALTAIMGAERAPYDAVVQIAGAGWSAPLAAVRGALDANAPFRRRILDYAQAFYTQVSVTAAINAAKKLDERLARWLLVARDRADGDELPLTHEYIAQMLGVRRAGVTIALQTLEQRGAVKGRRGAISILDREGLALHAQGAYTPADESMRARCAI